MIDRSPSRRRSDRVQVPSALFRSAVACLLDALFPPRCAGCDSLSRTVFCAECAATLARPGAPLCQLCGTPFDPLAFASSHCARCREKPPPFECARSALLYQETARNAVQGLKYRGFHSFAPRLAPLLKHALENDELLRDFGPTRLVPVPLHPSRRRQRGFNQSFLLARELGYLIAVPAEELLLRTRATPPQVGLQREERIKNVRGAFALDQKKVARLNCAAERILLIDDVFTTGATLRECARILVKKRARVACLTLTRQDTRF